MKGIPVLPNGDPVRRTCVVAANFREFSNWCMYSRVSPRSRNIRWLDNVYGLQGINDFDLVFTGSPVYADDISDALIMHQSLGDIKATYHQRESADIEPDIVQAERQNDC